MGNHSPLLMTRRHHEEQQQDHPLSEGQGRQSSEVPNKGGEDLVGVACRVAGAVVDIGKGLPSAHGDRLHKDLLDTGDVGCGGSPVVWHEA